MAGMDPEHDDPKGEGQTYDDGATHHMLLCSLVPTRVPADDKLQRIVASAQAGGQQLAQEA